jgi:hypothetical protein
MRDLKAFVLGSVALGVFAYALAAALAVAAQSGGRELRIALGPLVVVAVSRDAATTVTTFGTGLAVLAVVGGLLNLAAAHFLRRRGRPRVDRVD